jgi:MFS family permease
MSRSVWLVVLCSGTVLGLVLGVRHSLGLFLTPISVELDMGFGVFALGLGLMNLVWGLISPFAGAIADRHGAGRVVVVGGLCYAAGLLLLTVSGDGEQLLLGGILIGLGLSGGGFSVVLGAAGRAAPPEHRSKALGIVTMGGSLGQFVALPFMHAMIGGLGWGASLMVAAAIMLVMVPLASGVAGRPTGGAEDDQTLREALAEARDERGFWLLNAGFFVCGFHLAFVGVHLPSYLANEGFPSWLAATGLTLVGLFNAVGSYIFGALGGRYSKKTMLSLLYLSRAAIFLAFLVVPLTEASVLIFSAVIGFVWLGTVPLTSGLVATIFGTTYLSTLFGIVFVSHQIGSFFGSWLGGFVFDTVGSYEVMWWINVALAMLSAALHWPIAERPKPRLAPAQSAQRRVA